eukprot:GFYU01041370.1.p1 GENE.GFYU01041370.1~~GFYU01041370.1.p1  ORF type:complete len:226 (-),score=16.25 GFYU01041370.1:53-730(-)
MSSDTLSKQEQLEFQAKIKALQDHLATGKDIPDEIMEMMRKDMQSLDGQQEKDKPENVPTPDNTPGQAYRHLHLMADKAFVAIDDPLYWMRRTLNPREKYLLEMRPELREEQFRLEDESAERLKLLREETDEAYTRLDSLRSEWEGRLQSVTTDASDREKDVKSRFPYLYSSCTGVGTEKGSTLKASTSTSLDYKPLTDAEMEDWEAKVKMMNRHHEFGTEITHT